MNPPPNADQGAEYPGKELEAMSFASNYHRWIIAELGGFLGKRVVEVGAGRGDVSALLLEAGVQQLFAYEPSPKLFAVLREQFATEPRVTVVNGFFRPESAPPGIDAVVYINVLEHIEDDRLELRSVYQALGAGARLLVFVPALRWLYSNADAEFGHYRRYEGPELLEKVQEAGFEVEQWRYFDLAGIIPWYLNFVLLKRPLTTGSVFLYDRLAVPPMRRIEKWVKPPTGKNLLLVAYKR